MSIKNTQFDKVNIKHENTMKSEQKLLSESTISPKISVVIPVFNQSNLLKHTLESLKNQTFKDFETIVIDDASTDNSYEVAKEYSNKVFKNISNRGPAYNRNLGVKVAESDVIAFIDSDCIADENWLNELYKTIQDKSVGAVMGNTSIPNSTYIGNSISALGFPAGGSIGFEKMWKVDENGLTNHISSCNVAIKTSVLEQHGGFDESFPMAGGEDTELSHRYTKNGVKIKYHQHAKVYHVPRTSLLSFFRWQINRGRTNYHLKKKIEKVDNFIKLRLWSSKNVLKEQLFDKKLPMVFFLLSSSFVLQQYGYFAEKMKDKNSK